MFQVWYYEDKTHHGKIKSQNFASSFNLIGDTQQ